MISYACDELRRARADVELCACGVDADPLVAPLQMLIEDYLC